MGKKMVIKVSNKNFRCVKNILRVHISNVRKKKANYNFPEEKYTDEESKEKNNQQMKPKENQEAAPQLCNVH